VFSTAADNQPAVTVHVLQGERPMAVDNKSLGRFDLVGIPPSPRGIPQIEVTFDIDANGIVNVGAKDLGTGKQQQITVTGSSNLSEDDISKMQKEAEEHADEDKNKREEVETINQADTLVYTSEKMFKEMKGKVDKKKLEEINKDIDLLKKLLEPEKKDVDKIKKKLEEINQKMQVVSTEMYQKVAQEQAAKTAKAEKKTEKKGKEKVVDAEFKEKKK